MRHRIHQRKLNRTGAHRKAMQRNLAQSIIQHGQVTTTLAKAKDIRPFLERIVTLAVQVRRCAANRDPVGSLSARRRIQRILSDRCLIASEHQADYDAMSDAARAKTLRMQSGRRYRTGEPKGRLAFTAESVVHRLIETVAPRYEDRPGGYTRIVRLPDRRVGDHTQLALVQFVGEEEAPGTLTKPDKSARRRRTDARYAMAIRLGKEHGRRRPPTDAEAPEPPDDASDDTSPVEDQAAPTSTGATDSSDSASDDDTRTENQ